MNAVWLVMVVSALCGLVGFSETALTSLAGFVPNNRVAISDLALSITQCICYRIVHLIRGSDLSTHYIRPEQTSPWAFHLGQMVYINRSYRCSMGVIRGGSIILPPRSNDHGPGHEYVSLRRSCVPINHDFLQITPLLSSQPCLFSRVPRG